MTDVVRDVLIKVGLELDNKGIQVPDLTPIRQAVQSIQHEVTSTAMRGAGAALGGGNGQSAAQALGLGDLEDRLRGLSGMAGSSAQQEQALKTTETRINSVVQAQNAYRISANAALTSTMALIRGVTLLGSAMGSNTEQWLKMAAAAQGTIDIGRSVTSTLGRIPGGPVIGGGVAVAAGTIMLANSMEDYKRNAPRDILAGVTGNQNDGYQYQQQEVRSSSAGFGSMISGGIRSLGQGIGRSAINMNRMFGLRDDYGITASLWADDYHQQEREQEEERRKNAIYSDTSLRKRMTDRFYNDQNTQLDIDIGMQKEGWANDIRKGANGELEHGYMSAQDRLSAIEGRYAEQADVTAKFRKNRDIGATPGSDAFMVNQLGDQKQDLEQQKNLTQERLEILKEIGHELQNEKQQLLDNVQSAARMLEIEKQRADKEQQAFGHLSKGQQAKAEAISQRLAAGGSASRKEHEFLEKIGKGDNKYTQEFFREEGSKNSEVDKNLGRDERLNTAQQNLQEALKNRDQVIDDISEEIKTNMDEQIRQFKVLGDVVKQLPGVTQQLADAVSELQKALGKMQQQGQNNDIKRGAS